MSESKIYPVPAEFAAQANINATQYEEMYQQSVEDPEGFGAEQAENYLSWFKPWKSVGDWSVDEKDDVRTTALTASTPFPTMSNRWPALSSKARITA